MFLPPAAAKTSRVFRPVCRFVPPPAAAEQTGNKRGCGVVRMVSRGKETPGYGANRLRRIGADEWPLVRGVWDSESYRNKRLLDWRRAGGIKPHYRNMVSTPTFNSQGQARQWPLREMQCCPPVPAVDLCPFPCSSGSPMTVSAHPRLCSPNRSPQIERTRFEFLGGTAVPAVNLCPFPCSPGSPMTVSAHPRPSSPNRSPQIERTRSESLGGTAVPAVDLCPFPCSSGSPMTVSAHQRHLFAEPFTANRTHKVRVPGWPPPRPGSGSLSVPL